MEPTEILALPMGENDAGAATVKEYLKALLHALCTDGEDFSGKRPFGNSDWESDLEIALIKGGAIKGTLDAGGYPNSSDAEAAGKAIHRAIAAL